MHLVTVLRVGIVLLLSCVASTSSAAPGGIAASRGLVAEIVAEGLHAPTDLVFLPDGRLLVLEKGGRVRSWSAAGGLEPIPLLGLPVCTASEMGLLGAAVAGDRLYLYHTIPPAGDPRRCGEGSAAGRRNRVVRFTLRDGVIDAASLVVVLDGIRTDGGNHDGGGLAIGPDGFLYVATGDTGTGDGGPPGSSTNPYAGDPAALEGKILRLSLDGGPAPGNPFPGGAGAAPLVFAFGLRNPFRFAFDPAGGLLWAGDVGQSTLEEIDVIRAGDDLGWPTCEGRRPARRCPGTTVPPIFTYPHGPGGASVTGGVFWNGDYVFGDFVRSVVWRASLGPARDRFAGRPRRILRRAGGPVAFTVGPDGALWYVAFERGAVVRVAPRGP